MEKQQLKDIMNNEILIREQQKTDNLIAENPQKALNVLNRMRLENESFDINLEHLQHNTQFEETAKQQWGTHVLSKDERID